LLRVGAGHFGQRQIAVFSAVSGTEASGSLKHDSTDPRASKWKEAAVKALVSGRIAGNNKQLRSATQRSPEILFASYCIAAAVQSCGIRPDLLCSW
jgi:hypothetical protein